MMPNSIPFEELLEYLKTLPASQKKQIVETLKDTSLAAPASVQQASLFDEVPAPSPQTNAGVPEAIYVDGGAGPWVQKLGLGMVALGQVTDQDGFNLLGVYQDILKLPMPLQQVPLQGHPSTVIVCDFQDPNANQQKNNEAELVALIAGLQIALHLNVSKVYSDSQLILEYWSRNHVNAKKRQILKSDAPAKLKAIEQCSQLRATFLNQGGSLLKVSGSQNPADLGHHK